MQCHLLACILLPIAGDWDITFDYLRALIGLMTFVSAGIRMLDCSPASDDGTTGICFRLGGFSCASSVQLSSDLMLEAESLSPRLIMWHLLSILAFFHPGEAIVKTQLSPDWPNDFCFAVDQGPG